VLASAAVGVGCGLGGPGDKDEPDAQVWYDAADVDAAPESDATLDAEPEIDATVSEVQTIDATELREQEIPYIMGQTYVDLREAVDYNEGHIPRATNIPTDTLWDGSALVDGGDALETAAPVQDLPLFLYGWSAAQPTTEAIADAAVDLGYSDVYVLTGGIEAWRAAHFYEDINTQGILAHHYNPIPQNHFIVDTMDATSYAEGHITGALNIDTSLFFHDGQLIDNGQALLDQVAGAATAIVFYCINEGCSASEEACEAAELIEAYAETRIFHYPGGFERWENTANPVSCGTDPEGACP
jgi:rhodanese-related sulfurtransferase